MTVQIKDNHYVMGFQLLTADDDSITSVSFKGIEPQNGVYTYTINVSDAAYGFTAQELQNLKLYVVDYAYNETFGAVSLSDSKVQDTDVNRASLVRPRTYGINKLSMGMDLTAEQTETVSGPFSGLIAKLEKWN